MTNTTTIDDPEFIARSIALSFLISVGLFVMIGTFLMLIIQSQIIGFIVSNEYSLLAWVISAVISYFFATIVSTAIFRINYRKLVVN